jgi:hypothetical protein
MGAYMIMMAMVIQKGREGHEKLRQELKKIV